MSGDTFGDGEADMLAELARMGEERDKANESAEFARQWYAVRIRRLDDWVRANKAGIPKEIVDEFFSIRANGTANPFEHPEYASQMNVLRHRAEKAEAERDEAREQRNTSLNSNAKLREERDQHAAELAALRRDKERLDHVFKEFGPFYDWNGECSTKIYDRDDLDAAIRQDPDVRFLESAAVQSAA